MGIENIEPCAMHIVGGCIVARFGYAEVGGGRLSFSKTSANFSRAAR